MDPRVPAVVLHYRVPSGSLQQEQALILSGSEKSELSYCSDGCHEEPRETESHSIPLKWINLGFMVFDQGSQKWVNSPNTPCGMIKMISSSDCIHVPDKHISKPHAL